MSGSCVAAGPLSFIRAVDEGDEGEQEVNAVLGTLTS